MEVENHHEFLRKTSFFVPRSVTRKITSVQLKLLVRYGHWLEALAKGILTPITPDQEHFIQVAAGRAKPATDYEIAWVAYRGPGPVRRPTIQEPDDFEDMGSYGEGG